jgi:hypothetical protein
MEFTKNERRNAHIGIGVAFAILAILVVFFNDASEGVQGAIAMFAFFSAFVVYHALDERELRRERDD